MSCKQCENEGKPGVLVLVGPQTRTPMGWTADAFDYNIITTEYICSNGHCDYGSWISATRPDI